MNANIIYYKPFILPCRTKVAYTFPDGTSGEAFFAWYKCYDGKQIDNHDLYPMFRKVAKNGQMSNREEEMLYSIRDRNIELTLPIDSVKYVILHHVWNAYDIRDCTKKSYVRNIPTMAFQKDEHVCLISSVTVTESGDIILTGGVKETDERKFRDASFRVEDLLYQTQENLIITLYDAGEGRKEIIR